MIGNVFTHSIRWMIGGGLLLTGLIVPAGCGVFQSQQPLAVEDDVDVSRYLGKWYEIARYPNDFEQGCVGVTAQYSRQADGRIRVVNTCRDSAGEVTDRISGIARVADPTTNAKFKVSFFWPFEGDYWILEVGPDYEYAVVGEPSRTFFWILSRSPALDAGVYESILERMPDWGYDRDRLYIVPQPGTDETIRGD